MPTLVSREAKCIHVFCIDLANIHLHNLKKSF
jgi:hypothetical protein